MNRSPAKAALAIFLLVFALCLAVFGGHIYSPDGEILFRTTEALATRGSLAITPLLGFATRPTEPPRADGREIAQYGVGQPILAVPFYWLGRTLEGLAPAGAWVALQRRMQSEYPAYGPPNTGAPQTPEARARDMAARLGVALFNPVVTALAAAVLFLLAQRLTDQHKPAWIAAIAWGVASLPLAHARTFFTEPLAGLCVLTSLLLLARAFGIGERQGTHPRDLAPFRFRWPSLVAAGIAAGYAALVRLDSVVFLPALGLIAFFGDVAPDRGIGRRLAAQFARPDAWLRLVAYAAPPALAGLAILALNQAHFGSPLASGYSDQPEGITFSTPLVAGLYGFTMSVGKGLFFFSPPLVLCFFGFRPLLRRRPVFGGGVLLLIASFLVFQSCWRNWAGGWCWGPRHIYQIHALLALAVGFWVADRWNPTRRVVIAALLLVGLCVQVYGSSQNFIMFYRILYQDPAPPTARVMYDPATAQSLADAYALAPRDPRTGRIVPTARPLPIGILPAPINDSIYILQNSQWPGYAKMWHAGFRDFFWVNLFSEE